MSGKQITRRVDNVTHPQICLSILLEGSELLWAHLFSLYLYNIYKSIIYCHYLAQSIVISRDKANLTQSLPFGAFP